MTLTLRCFTRPFNPHYLHSADAACGADWAVHS